MRNLSRREFVIAASSATLSAAASSSICAPCHQRVFVSSKTPDGILAYDWDAVSAELTPVGVVAKLANVEWLALSTTHEFLYAASAVRSFNGKPSGEVAGFRVENGKLRPVSAENSAGTGTCHVALDQTGHVLLSADYAGGSAVSFLIEAGRVSPAVWTEHYTEHGPDADRQQTAHAHFASFSPNNRFAYFNDLGGDCIHIYSLNTATAMLTPAGIYRTRPGAGPRTLHFHPNGHIAYSVNELDSTVDLLEWNMVDGALTRVKRIDLLPEGFHGISHACDTVISRDGRNVYFANRDEDFLYHFRADTKTGYLTPKGRTNCGGRIPRNFVLDPTERSMLVANQGSIQISVFARNPQTGALAEESKSIAATAPMCILFA